MRDQLAALQMSTRADLRALMRTGLRAITLALLALQSPLAIAEQSGGTSAEQSDGIRAEQSGGTSAEQAEGIRSQQAAGISPDRPPFALTLAQARHWSPPLAGEKNAVADSRNISTVPLAGRFAAPLDPQSRQDRQAKVLYAPDGMNNFANYLQAQPQFNLYNFSNWQQIDILNWFAGTADLTVQIPARPWVDTAHKNGVKVLGSVFLGIAQWGGSADTVEKLLEQDDQGRFVIANQLVRIALYYGFDGWLVNQETDLTAVKDAQNQLVKGQKDPERGRRLALKLQEFMTYLTAIAPDGMEIHWYDAMVPDGRVRWQNELNAQNLPYLQQGKVGAAGSETRADAIFLNYWWQAEMVQRSKQLAESLGLSRYQLYFGADLWPERDAQQAFKQSRWLHDLFVTDPQSGQTQAQASIALFAPNVNFNFAGTQQQPAYSTFGTDPADVQRFYQTEQRLFVGDDGNLALTDHQTDATAWPGLGAYLPAKSVLARLPFATHFNTGQGRFWFVQGKAGAAPFVSAESGAGWTDISQQDFLPSWQFALLGQPDVVNAARAQYDFAQAWQGGSSLLLTLGKAGQLQWPLYQFDVELPASARLTLRYQLSGIRAAGALPAKPLQLLLDTDRGPLTLTVPAQADKGWQLAQLPLQALAGARLQRLSVLVDAPAGAAVRLGQLEIRP